MTNSKKEIISILLWIVGGVMIIYENPIIAIGILFMSISSDILMHIKEAEKKEHENE